MDRARAAVSAAIFAVLMVASVALGAVAPVLLSAVAPAAAVAWPPSTLVVSEIQTGGASASDEFVEIANVGPSTVDLAGMEVVYVTSTGGTITRKATWSTPTSLAPGRHLLLANTSGVYASVADAVYSGGLAATGGTIVLRVVGGAPVDTTGWGDATNTFVEGAPAAAPSAGSSLERRPGGTSGNTTDTNNNASDFFAQVTPNPQNLAAPPVPAPAPSPTPTPPLTPSPMPTSTPTPTSTISPSPDPTTSPGPTISPDPSPTGAPPPDPTPPPEPTSTPSATPDPTASTPPDPSPTPEPAPSPTPDPTASPTPVPTPTATPTPTPTATPVATPAPTPTPTPTAVPIVDARALPDGSPTVVEGVLTTALGSLESGRVGFIQDGTAGIAIYLDAALSTPLSAGTSVRLPGIVDERYGARTLRVAAANIVDLGLGALPEPGIAATGAVGEALEGRRITITGTTVGASTTYADGLGILVDDGSGAVRVIIGPDALGGASLPAGASVTAIGPVGQRDSTGTGTSGYRIQATLPGELVVLPDPTPSPTPTATPTPSPTPDPAPTPTPTPEPTPTASPDPTPMPTLSPAPSPTPVPALTIEVARARPVGSTVTIVAVVTAEAGRLGTPPLIAVGDDTGGIPVRLPDGTPPPARGRLVRVTGKLAAPNGQLEIHPATGGIEDLGSATIPVPLGITAADLGEGTEGRLIAIVGTQAGPPRRSVTGDITIDVTAPDGRTFRVMTDASSGITVDDLRAGVAHRFAGIVGQRASRKGALDGYRVWLRDRADIGSPTSSIAPVGSSVAPSPSGAAAIAIGAARRLDGTSASVVGVVTVGAGLLDAQDRLIVIQDASGAIEVLLPVGATAPGAGSRVRIDGTVNRAWGAPRLRAATTEFLGAGAAISPRALGRSPGEADEGQLVRVAGSVTSVTRLADRWRADLRVGEAEILITGLTGSGIPSTTLEKGQAVTIIGIVRRPYPTARDQRWAVAPRGPQDVAVGPATGGNRTTAAAGPGGSSTAWGAASLGTAGTEGSDGAVPADLATLEEHLDSLVRVGGLVAEARPDGFLFDDGTAVGTAVLVGEAASFRELVRPGDAVGLVGRVVRDSAGLRVVVEDPAGIVRLGALGEVVPIAATRAVDPSAVPVAPAGLATASFTGPLASFGGGWLGAVGFISLSAASLVGTMARRRRAQRRLIETLHARIAGLPRSTRGA